MGEHKGSGLAIMCELVGAAACSIAVVDASRERSVSFLQAGTTRQNSRIDTETTQQVLAAGPLEAMLDHVLQDAVPWLAGRPRRAYDGYCLWIAKHIEHGASAPYGGMIPQAI